MLLVSLWRLATLLPRCEVVSGEVVDRVIEMGSRMMGDATAVSERRAESLSTPGAHHWEEDDVPNRLLSGKKHCQSIYAESHSGRRGHADLECC